MAATCGDSWTKLAKGERHERVGPASLLHPFLTRLVTSPASARFLPAIEDSDSPCALCARMLQRAFNEQRIGNADCMTKAAVLIPKW